MRVIAVIDLLAGRAVHARAGHRRSYAAVEHVAGAAIEPGDPLALARAYVDRLGIRELYVADLDAILGGPPQDALVDACGRLGVPLWVDGGAASVDRAAAIFRLGAARVVAGLETLPSFDALDLMCAAADGAVAFSLDLRNGAPIVAPSGEVPAGMPAQLMASRAARAGVGAVIVLDLARVGTGAGLDTGLIARVRQSAPDVDLLAGGGVGDAGDFTRLADAGCTGVLVATALQDGRIGAREIEAAQRLERTAG